MRKLRRYFLLSIILTLVLVLSVGCGAKQSEPRNVAIEDRDHMAPEEASEDIGTNEEMGFEKDEKSPLEPEKVITTIYMDFETTEFEKSSQSLNNAIKKHGGYVENSSVDYGQYRNNKRYRNAFYVIRVPKDKVLDFKSELKGVGNISSESTNKEDVTKQYRDTESRLKVLEVKEERILALLSKAEKIEDIIKLEKELSEVIYEKEQLKTNLMNIDDKVDFSTLEINIREVEKLTTQDTVETKFSTKVKNVFNDSLYFFKRALEGLIILLVYILPFAIVIGVIAYFVAKFWKRKSPPKE